MPTYRAYRRVRVHVTASTGQVRRAICNLGQVTRPVRSERALMPLASVVCGPYGGRVLLMNRRRASCGARLGELRVGWTLRESARYAAGLAQSPRAPLTRRRALEQTESLGEAGETPPGRISFLSAASEY